MIDDVISGFYSFNYRSFNCLHIRSLLKNEGHLISIGDELLIGQTTNTMFAFIVLRLSD